MGPNLYISPGTIDSTDLRELTILFHGNSISFPSDTYSHIKTSNIGGGYTQFHQDGHGTVDSGHSCLSGYNEVVMLRRLPECHKRQACQLIPSTSSIATTEQDPNGAFMDVACQNQAENVLYRLPHDDFRSDKLTWAQTSTIEEWNKLG
jgi:hypothetical protein